MSPVLRHLVPALLGMLVLGCASTPQPSNIEAADAEAPEVPDAQTLSAADPALDPQRLVVVTVRNLPGPSIPRAGSTLRDYDGRGLYSISPAARATARAIAAQHRLREISSWPIVALGVHCLVFELPAGASRGLMLETLRHDQRVESAQALQTFDTLSTASPAHASVSDPESSAAVESSSYNDPYERLQNNLQTLGIRQAHEWSRGEGVNIAVIDTAVDAAHPDLAGQVIRQQSFLDPASAKAGSPVDRVRHGTAVAGVIAALANNRQGIVGIAPAARLFAMNACWPDARAASRSMCNTFTLAKALAAAIDARVHIINLSLAGPSDLLLTRLVNHAMQRGIIVVGAAAADERSEYFPADIAGVISVLSAAIPPISQTSIAQNTSLLAPGTDVLTLVPAGHYDFQSGSSLATASVSGGIALLLARDHKLRGPEARRLLASSSQSAMTAAGETYSINICAALASLLRQPECRAASADSLPPAAQTSAIP